MLALSVYTTISMLGIIEKKYIENQYEKQLNWTDLYKEVNRTDPILPFQ